MYEAKVKLAWGLKVYAMPGELFRAIGRTSKGHILAKEGREPFEISFNIIKDYFRLWPEGGIRASEEKTIVDAGEIFLPIKHLINR